MFKKEGSKNGHFQKRKILKIAFLRLLETFLKGKYSLWKFHKREISFLGRFPKALKMLSSKFSFFGMTIFGTFLFKTPRSALKIFFKLFEFLWVTHMNYSNPHDPWETDPSLSLTRGKWVTHMSGMAWLVESLALHRKSQFAQGASPKAHA